MTSTNDGKDVKSYQTSGQKGKSYYIELYKSLDARLSGECGLGERTQHLCEAWRRVHSLCLHSAPATHPHLLSWLQRHTARTILHTKWSKEEQDSLEEAIDAFIEETKTGRACKDGVSPPWESQLLLRGQWFRRELANPWGHPVLRLLLDPKEEPPADDEILGWLKEERGVMFVTRLRQLATSKCGDLAVHLVAAVMDRVRASAPLVPDSEQSDEPRDKPKAPSEKPTFADILTAEAGFTVEVWELLTDIEFVLLHKGDSRSKCIDLAKQTPLRNGYQLVERLQGRLETSPREKKLWKNAKDVATLIAQVVIARCMVVPVCSNVSRTALYCCARALVRLLAPGRLQAAAAALAAPAATARHLHTLAAATLAQRGAELTPFVCELYVRAITAGMNELERLKLNAEKEAEARQQEQTLSTWFTQLGTLLSKSSRLRCECTLTAFSVHPSPAMYVCIQQAPLLPSLAVEQDVKEETTSEFGSWATDSRTQTNLVKTSETLNLKHTQHQANVLSTAILAEGEALGLSAELCQDLAVLLSGPRVKTLSLDMDREALLENCRGHMERTHGGTRALTTELRFLNLDPRAYQHLPEEDDAENDAFYGIEKGYEHLVEVQEQEEIWQDAYSDPERTESVCSSNSDIPTTVKKKKKKKAPILSSEEDSDPLSLVAEAKRTEKKKERPHSKERSRERKEKKKSKAKDGTEKKESSRERLKEGSDPKQKKEKKPRKKKIKEEIIVVDPKPGSLSSLIGMKVAKVKVPEGKYKRNTETSVSAPCITDSDYDSQGKSSLASLNSEGNDPDVLFDGLYNMEDYRSPEKGDPLADGSTYTSSELSVANGRVAINTTSLLRKDDQKCKLQTIKNNASKTPSSDLNNSKNAAIREEVKRSISKLIEFRRQKSLLEETQILKSSGSSPATSNSDKCVSPKSSPIVRPNSDNSAPLIKSPNAIIRPEFPEPAVISPKAVEVPEIPKAYINKKQVESLKELKHGVDMLLHAKYSNNPVIQNANKQPAQPSCESSFQQYVQQRQQLFTQLPNFEINKNRSNISVIHKSIEDPEKEIQKNFQDFLRELQESINAGTGANKKANTPKNVPARKDIKPISRVTPVIPNFLKTEPGTSYQCAKSTIQSTKKVDSQLNTFARLSYMHKNKQSDVKCNKQSAELSNQDQIMSRFIDEQKSAKIKYLQAKGDISILRVGQNAHPLRQDAAQVIIRKMDKPSPTALEHPVLTNMLHGSNAAAAKKPPRNETHLRSVPYQPEKSMVKDTALSEQDQNDLLLLLRQQNKLNSPAPYLSPDINRIVNNPQHLKSAGASSPISLNHSQVTSAAKSVTRYHPTEIKSNKVQNYEGCKVRTVFCDSIPEAHTKFIDCKLGKVSKTTTSKKKSVTAGKVQNVTPCNNQVNFSQTYGLQDNVSQSADTNKPNITNKVTKVGTIKKPNITLTKVPNAVCQTQQPSFNLGATITPRQNILPSGDEPQDWESVMDALLSHKTPSLGPNALDVALKKDSFAKTALRNQRIVRKKELKVHDNIPHKQSNSTKDDVGTPTHMNANPEQSVITDLSKKITIQNKDTETVRVESLKRDVQKPLSCEAKKERDPFISGIPNSDYDLLEELMDDELRKEIGELSSDEDTYRAPAVSTKVIKTAPSSKCSNVIKNLSHQDIEPADSRRGSSSIVQNVRESIIQTNKRVIKTYEAPKNVYTNRSLVQAINIANTKSHEAENKTKLLDNATRPCSKTQVPVVSVHSHSQNSEIQAYNVNKNSNRCHVNLVGNMSIAATTVKAQSNPVQSEPATPKVVVIGSEVLYDPISIAAVQTPIPSDLGNVNQPHYTALNTTPNIALYQTTQFAAPIVNPVIIGNAMTVSTAEKIQETTPFLSSAHSQNISRSQIDVSEAPEIAQDCVKASLENDINVETKSKNTHDLTLQQDANSKVDIKTHLDNNFNKNAERKVLSEVQDKQTVNFPEKVDSKATRNQKLPPESDVKKEFLKDEVSEIQKQPNILDNTSKQVNAEDLERIMMKRMAILNRTTLHTSSKPPIPLDYRPLITLKQNKNNVAITGQDNTNLPISSIENCNVENTTADNVLNNKIVSNQDNHLNNEHCKENDSKTTPCCRILLRSSNDLKAMTVTSNLQDQRNPVGRKTKVRLKSETKNIDSDVNRKSTTEKDDTDSSKRISKRILNKKRTSLQKVENEDDTIKQGSNQANKINEKELNVIEQVCDSVDIIKDHVVSKVVSDSKIVVLPTNINTDPKEVTLIGTKSGVNDLSSGQNIADFGLIDIEDALLGSKIPKLKEPDINAAGLKINEIESNQETVRPRSARKKRKPRKYSEEVNINLSSDNENETSDQAETDLEQPTNQNNSLPLHDKESTKTGVTISIIRSKKASGKPKYGFKIKPNLETKQTRAKNMNKKPVPVLTGLKKTAKTVDETKNCSDVSEKKSLSECGIKIINLKTNPEITIRPTKTKRKSLIQNQVLVISGPKENDEKLPDTTNNNEVCLKESLSECESTVDTTSTKKSYDCGASNVKRVSMITEKNINNNISESGIQTRQSKSKDSINGDKIEFSQETKSDIVMPHTDSKTKIVEDVVPPKLTSKTACNTTGDFLPSKIKSVTKNDVVPIKLTSPIANVTGNVASPKLISEPICDLPPEIRTESVATSDLVSPKIVTKSVLNKSTEQVQDNIEPVKGTTPKLEDTVMVHDAFKDLKDKIIIEELPPPPNDPSKKCVRIKLPNGKIFKATVFGKMHVSFDSIFADPALKSALLSNLTDSKRYTVNIKQVSTTAKNDPKTIVDARIEEVNVQARDIQPIETVNLLSDDEEETDSTNKIQTFKTEFGECKINSVNEKDFQSHQEKLQKKCFVKLIPMVHPKSSFTVDVAPKLLSCDSDKKAEMQGNNILHKIKKDMAAIDKEINAINTFNDLSIVTLNKQINKSAHCPIKIYDNGKDDIKTAINNKTDKSVSCPIIIDDDSKDLKTPLNNQTDNASLSIKLDYETNLDDLTMTSNQHQPQKDVSLPTSVTHHENKDTHTATSSQQRDKNTSSPVVFDNADDTHNLTKTFNHDLSLVILNNQEYKGASSLIKIHDDSKDDIKTTLNNQTDKNVSRPVVLDSESNKGNLTTSHDAIREAINPGIIDNENNKENLITALGLQTDTGASCPIMLEDNKDSLTTILIDQTDNNASYPAVSYPIDDDKSKDTLSTALSHQTTKDAGYPMVLNDLDNKDNLTITLNNLTNTIKSCPVRLDHENSKEKFTNTLSHQLDKDTNCPNVLDEDDNKENPLETLTNQTGKDATCPVILEDEKHNFTTALYNQTDQYTSSPIVLDDENIKGNLITTFNNLVNEELSLPIEIYEDSKNSLITLRPNTIVKEIPDIIEIDDSSNDSMNLLDTSIAVIEETLRKEIANVLKKPILLQTSKEIIKKPDEDIDKLKMLLLEDLGVEVPNVENKQPVTNLIVIENDEEESSLVKTKECFVRLENCDELAEEYKMKRIIKQKCVVDLVRCDDMIVALEKDLLNASLDKKHLLKNGSDDLIELDAVEADTSFNSESKRSRSGSFSLLDEFPVLFENKVDISYEFGRSSPVMDVFNAIAALQGKHKAIMKDNLPERLDEASSDIIELARSSPVMEIFETIASYQRIFEVTHKKETMSEKYECCCDWYKTKRDLHLVNPEKVSIAIQHAGSAAENHFIINNSLAYQTEITTCIDQLFKFDTHEEVPTLKTLAVKLFQSDEILSRLRPNTLFLKKETDINPSYKLKRKLHTDEEKGVASKVSKVVTNNIPKNKYKLTSNKSTESTSSEKNKSTKKPEDTKSSETIVSNLLDVCPKYIKVSNQDTDVEEITSDEKIEVISGNSDSEALKLVSNETEMFGNYLQNDTSTTSNSTEMKSVDITIRVSVSMNTVCQENAYLGIDNENQPKDFQKVVETSRNEVIEFADEEEMAPETNNTQDYQLLGIKETDLVQSSSEKTPTLFETVCDTNIAMEFGYEKSAQISSTQNNSEKIPEASKTVYEKTFGTEIDSENINQTQINVKKTPEVVETVHIEIINSTSKVSQSAREKIIDATGKDKPFQLQNYNQETTESSAIIKCKGITDSKTCKETQLCAFTETDQLQNCIKETPSVCEIKTGLETNVKNQLMDSTDTHPTPKNVEDAPLVLGIIGQSVDSSETNNKNHQTISGYTVSITNYFQRTPDVLDQMYKDKRNLESISPVKETPKDLSKVGEKLVCSKTHTGNDQINSNYTEIQSYLKETSEVAEAVCKENVNSETDAENQLFDIRNTNQKPKHIKEAPGILETICEETVDLKTENGSEQADHNKTDQPQKKTPSFSESLSSAQEYSNKTCEQTVNVHIDVNNKHDTKLSRDFQSNANCLYNGLRKSSDSNKEPIAISDIEYKQSQDISGIIKDQSDKTPVETQTSCETIDTNFSSKSDKNETRKERNYETPGSQEITEEVIIQQNNNSKASNQCNHSIKTSKKESIIENENEIRSTEEIVNNKGRNSSHGNESKKIIKNEDEMSKNNVIIVSDQSNVLSGEKTSSATQPCLRFEYKIEVEHQSEDSNSELVAFESSDESKQDSYDKNDLLIFDNIDVENEIEIICSFDAKVDINEQTIYHSQDSISTEKINIEEQVQTAKAEYLKSNDSNSEIKEGGEIECFCYKKQDVQTLDHGYALENSCLDQNCKINSKRDVSVPCEPSPKHKNTVGDRSNNEVVLNGIEYEDPVIGTCYVFPLAESPTDCETDSDIFNDSTEEIIQVTQEISDDGTVDKVVLETKEISIEEPYLKLNIPKLTYSKHTMYYEKDSKPSKRSLKRKIDMTDIIVSRKKYRKGKNIDYPKITASAIRDSAYSKEYKQVFDYCSSLKFSYSQPFHRDFIDVEDIIKDWPLQGEYSSDFQDQIDSNDLLFSDLDIQQYDIPFDPMEQSLAEELTVVYKENLPCSSVTETNFNMGFGEGSDRVIQNLKDVDDDSKFSAATLSDVKQPQPFLLSEYYENGLEETNKNTREDQIKQLKRFITYIQMRDKVRSFFRKTTVELKYDWLKKQEKDQSTSFPFDLYNTTDFIDVPPADVFVQVVQVGQLPVSAAAQNPVTCDPRVTQVSNASPSQCSVDNSPQDDSQPTIKTEYTELTTADLSNLPLVQEYAQHHQTLPMESQEQSNVPLADENIPIETEIKSVVKIELMEETEVKEEQRENYDNSNSPSMENRYVNNVDYSFDTNVANATSVVESEQDFQSLYHSADKQNITEIFSTQHQQQPKQQNGTPEKTDQIAHAMNAAGITTIAETMTNTTRAQALVNILSQKLRQGSVGATQSTTNNYTKATSINAMSLQQALAQILPPPLNQTTTTENNQHNQNTSVTPQVLHIVQGKNASGSQITLVDNSQQSVINGPNATPVLHIVQNKSGTTGATSNGATTQQTNSFGGLSLVDAGLQQGGNQLLHIVNTGNQKNSNATGQLLKRVNLLTNLANVQGSNEQKMVQFVCKSADGKSIQLNAPHQRSMVLRLQPIETPNVQTTPKPAENQDLSPTSNSTNSLGGKDNAVSQQEIKSRSVYEENYAKFIQNSSSKTMIPEKSTSLPKFNQAFGKPVFQDGSQKQNDMNSNNSHLTVNTNSEGGECQSDNAINLDHIGQISSPPLLLRKSPAQTSQSQSSLVQQIKQTITPMNIQTMHGGVIYTRQIPVNIGGGQTINLITVPSTELVDESGQKQPTGTQNEIEPSIIKIVPQNQTASNSEISSEDSNAQMNVQTETNQNPQPQPVLTQMRIKLPMLSKTPQMVSGARVVRPSFFQIQRNVIGGANQPVYQQLVLTAAPPLGQQTIRLPQTQTNRQIKVPAENQSSAESQMSSSTLEQLREFDMVLEQVKERSSVPPNSNSSTTFSKLHTSSTDTTDSSASSTSTETTQQVLYSIGNNHQPLNVAYVNRKATVVTPTTSTFVRSPDSSGIVDSPTSSAHVQIPHTVTTDSSHSEPSNQPKPKISSKSKSRPKSSSNPPNTLKINTVPPKTSTQKPLEDEQTTQRILYILAEYKEQVENSPDKDKPAPRRRSNPPSNPSGSSKRKKSSSGSRRHGGRDISPIHGEDTCRTMGSEDSSCGTSQGDCNESCLESHSPQDSPRKVVRKLTFEHETPPPQPRPQPQRNVIVADGQTITVARGTAGKPATAVLMPANYILPVSMVKGGQQIAIVTNRGPKLLTVGGGEGGATNALLLQRLIGPAGLKPVLARPGVRHVRLPTAALHNLQAFNLATATTIQPPDSTASPAPAPTPPELVDTRATSSPWTDRDCQEDVKPERGSSPEGSEPWNLPSSGDPHDYTYEETVRADNLDRTVLDAIPDRYSPDMEAQRIFDKMFDVDSKKSYLGDSPRCVYDIDASDCDDKPYHQVVQKKDGHRQHRLTHVSAAALRHKYAILEHELRLQKSLSEECEDLGVDSPSASELFPEAELLFAASPAHDHAQDQGHHSHTPQPTLLNQSGIPQPDIDDQIATDQLLTRGSRHDEAHEQHELQLGLDDVGMVGVGVGAGLPSALDAEEFARAHPNTTFHSEPTDDEPVQPFTIAGLKARHITSTIFHSNRAPATVLMTAPQTTVISQATADGTSHNAVKYDIDNMINSLPSANGNNINLSSVLVKDEGLTRFDSILNDSRELHLSNTASAIVHSAGNATQVIRRVCYDDDKNNRFLMDEPDALIAGDDAKMIAEDSSRDATLESMVDGDDDRSSPERHADLFWESNSASGRSESRRPLDFSSDSDKCCKSPSYDETNSTDSSGLGAHMRLDSVIKDARGIERSGSADGSSADDTHPPLRTYPPKRMYHPLEREVERSLSGKTRAGERSPDSLEVRRRASGRGVVKRGCHCCNGSPAPPRTKKSRQRKPTMDFTN